NGVIKLKGTIGDITFYKSNDGYLAREKGGVDANRIAKDPAFQRTRENGAEFGRAGKSGRLLRTALKPYFKNYADARMVSRLTQVMMKVIQADQVSERGKRNVIDGEAVLLTGFEFNIRGKLSNTFYSPYTVLIDRVTGKMNLNVSPFVSENLISAPGGSTHFKIISVAAEIDFNEGTFVVDKVESNILPLTNIETPAIEQECSITPDSVHPLFFVLGIEFYQEINDEMYPLKNGAFNSLAIVKVDGGL